MWWLEGIMSEKCPSCNRGELSYFVQSWCPKCYDKNDIESIDDHNHALLREYEEWWDRQNTVKIDQFLEERES
jgi:uncharacterized OB-fold protein